MPHKEKASETESCPVCCDQFTAKLRPSVRCPACSYGACVRCIKTYLCSSLSDPSCMNCGLHFNRSFLDEHLTPTWRNGELKKHRQNVLFDRERSLIPATQPQVEREATRVQLENAKQDAFRAYKYACRAQQQLRRDHQAAMRALRIFRTPGTREPEVHERRSFVAACPSEECKGFLSTQYKCGTCLRQFCSSCRELKEANHRCDPDTVETIKAILQDSRACPGCGMSINRVSGCDQMYCTQCDVPFSYATGERIRGIIHNPHYFERLRQMRAQVGTEDAEEPPREVYGGCGRWPSMAQFRWLEGPEHAMLTSFHRTATNIEHTILPRMALFDRGREDNSDLRVQYCLNALEEKRFKMHLEQRERKREFDVDVRECLQLFVLLSIELAYRLANDHERRIPKAKEVLLAHLAQTEELVNAPLQDIAKRFKKETPRIIFPKEWTSMMTDGDFCVMPGRTNADRRRPFGR